MYVRDHSLPVFPLHSGLPDCCVHGLCGCGVWFVRPLMAAVLHALCMFVCVQGDLGGTTAHGLGHCC